MKQPQFITMTLSNHNYEEAVEPNGVCVYCDSFECINEPIQHTSDLKSTGQQEMCEIMVPILHQRNKNKSVNFERR